MIETYTGTGVVINQIMAREYGYSQENISRARTHPKGLLQQEGLPDVYLTTLLESTNVAPRGPEILNRTQRRMLDRTNPSCRNCSIRWSDRFDMWSTCTVQSPPSLIAEGHRFL